MSSTSSASLPAPSKIRTENLRRPKALPETSSTEVEPFKLDQIPATIGRYQIQGELGRGGMGIILRGFDSELGREAAIKVLPTILNETPYLRNRFIEEASFASQLQHPNIVPVYESGFLEDTRPYFVMQAVHGTTLAAALSGSHQGPTSLPHYLNIFRQVCQAVAFAHSRGILHRDLKPGNVMLGNFGEVFVVDWGLARKLGDSPLNDPVPHRSDAETQVDKHNQTSHLIGTPAYMAPEQAIGLSQSIDTRSDVFGLGAILCEILTGQPPYTGNDTKEIHRLAEKGDQSMLQRRLEQAKIDLELRELVQVCLRPNPAERPKDGGEVLAKIEGYLDSLEQRAHLAELARVESETLAKSAVKRRKLVFGIAICLGFVLALGAIGAYREYHWELEKERRQTALQLQIVPLLSVAENDLFSGNYSKAIQTIQNGSLLFKESNQENLSAQALAIQEDALFLGFLEQVRRPEAELDPSFNLDPKLCELIERAFDVYRIHPLKTPLETIIKKFQNRSTRLQVVAALDAWAWGMQRSNPETAKRLHDVAGELEPEAYLPTALRESSVRNEPQRLQELAREVRVKDCTCTHLTHLLSLLIRHGMNDEAERLAAENARQRPENYWSHSLLGAVLLRNITDNTDQSSRHLNLGQALKPKWTLTEPQTDTLLDALSGFNQPEEFKHYLFQSGIPQTAVEIGVLQKARAGKYRDAENALAKIAPQRESNAGYELLRAKVLGLGGDEPTAIDALRIAHLLDPNNLEILLFLAELLSEKQPEQAEKILEKVLTQNPNCVGAHLAYTQISVRSTDPKIYEQRLANTLKLAPNNPDVYLKLAQSYALWGNPNKALELHLKGCEIGVKIPGWNPPSDAAVARFQRLIIAYERFEDYQSGKLILHTRGMPPRYNNPEQAVTVAVWLARPIGNQPAKAAEIFRNTFRDNPKLISETSIRIGYPVACLAALVATGQAPDTSANLLPRDRTEWSQIASLWLAYDLARLAELAKTEPDNARRRCRTIKTDLRLAPFRESEFLDKLPKEDQATWAKIWQQLDDLAK